MITELKNSTYFARLILQQQNELARKIAGKTQYPIPNESGMLSTGGDLVFTGHSTGRLVAYDADNLKEVCIKCRGLAKRRRLDPAALPQVNRPSSRTLGLYG